ncbi:hypothetical protein B0T09DRAFT_385827 [Sordaria sp. MPI-SDFR-AT-0083]|nr:hypothetical protein B0T09DRAFT_385827 [Sordaria sp. MPI-SDFR-AT-0083]
MSYDNDKLPNLLEGLVPDHSDSEETLVGSEQHDFPEQFNLSDLERLILVPHWSGFNIPLQQAPMDPALISSRSKTHPQELPAQALESQLDVKTADQRKHVFGHHGQIKPEWQTIMNAVIGIRGDR